MGTPRIPLESRRAGSRCCGNPAGMEIVVARLSQECRRNAEITTYCIVMLLLLCMQWQKRIRQQLFESNSCDIVN